MNILFMSLLKLEDMNESNIYTDLLREFRNHGHNVYAISPREKRLGLMTEYKLDSGINTLKVRIGNISSKSILEKGISTLSIKKHYRKAVSTYFKDVKFDLILYTTPPITFASVVDFVKKRDGATSYLLLKDIFPQNAVDLEMFSKDGVIHKYFRNEEKKLYKVSDYIGTMSQANSDYILNNNSTLLEEQVEITPNTITPIDLKLEKNEIKEIRNEFGIPQDKITFIYGGNLGKPQGVDYLIDCIKENEKSEDTFILIVGSGTEYSRLKKEFEELNPSNSKLIKSLPKEKYEYVVNSADVGLIFLDSRFTIPNFPSRLLSYLQAGMPVLAATDSVTDVGKVIEEGKFGYWNESDDIKAFHDNMAKFLDDKQRNIMGNNAKKYLEKHYTSDKAYNSIIKHFEK